jgi:hypothetical protein
LFARRAASITAFAIGAENRAPIKRPLPSPFGSLGLSILIVFQLQNSPAALTCALKRCTERWPGLNLKRRWIHQGLCWTSQATNKEGKAEEQTVRLERVLGRGCNPSSCALLFGVEDRGKRRLKN